MTKYKIVAIITLIVGILQVVIGGAGSVFSFVKEELSFFVIFGLILLTGVISSFFGFYFFTTSEKDRDRYFKNWKIIAITIGIEISSLAVPPLSLLVFFFAPFLIFFFVKGTSLHKFLLSLLVAIWGILSLIVALRFFVPATLHNLVGAIYFFPLFIGLSLAGVILGTTLSVISLAIKKLKKI